MKPTRLVVIFIGLLFFNGVLAGTASATPVAACQGQHAVLRADTLAAESSFTNYKDVEDSIATLDAAWPWLAVGKSPVSVQLLTDFQTKLNGLSAAPQPQLDPAVAQRLTAQAQGVIDCVNSIGP